MYNLININSISSPICTHIPWFVHVPIYKYTSIWKKDCLFLKIGNKMSIGDTSVGGLQMRPINVMAFKVFVFNHRILKPEKFPRGLRIYPLSSLTHSQTNDHHFFSSVTCFKVVNFCFTFILKKLPTLSVFLYN